VKVVTWGSKMVVMCKDPKKYKEKVRVEVDPSSDELDCLRLDVEALNNENESFTSHSIGLACAGLVWLSAYA